VLVHIEASAIVGAQAGRLEPQRVGRPAAAYAVEHLVRHDLLAAGEPQAHVMAVLVVIGLDRRHLFAEVKRALFPEVIDERVDDLPIDEGKELGAGIDQCHADAEGREDAPVLEADHARTDHGQRARKLIEAQKVIAREHMLSVARRERIAHRRRPDGDDDGAGP
jgi:hypothetical protein